MDDHRTVTLSDDEAAFVDDLVASGLYRSASEVVQAGLAALRDKDCDLDEWIRSEVVPVYDAVKADPSREVPVEQGFAELRARYGDARRADE